MTSNRIKCIIVDDEPLALSLLANHVSKVPFLELVFTATDPIDALQRLQAQPVELVFLDIQMREITGIQFMKIVSGKCRAILTTAYTEYALEGYEHNVIDYLLKPISFDRFYRASLKAHDVFRQSVPPTRAEAQQAAVTNISDDHIFVRTDSRMVKVLLAEVLYIEGLKDYIAIQTTTERIVVLENLKTMEDRLESMKFLRIHRSYIVALNKIDAIERNRIFMGNTAILPIGDTYREAFFAAIKDRNFGR